MSSRRPLSSCVTSFTVRTLRCIASFSPKQRFTTWPTLSTCNDKNMKEYRGLKNVLKNWSVSTFFPSLLSLESSHILPETWVGMMKMLHDASFKKFCFQKITNTSTLSVWWLSGKKRHCRFDNEEHWLHRSQNKNSQQLVHPTTLHQ